MTYCYSEFHLLVWGCYHLSGFHPHLHYIDDEGCTTMTYCYSGFHLLVWGCYYLSGFHPHFDDIDDGCSMTMIYCYSGFHLLVWGCYYATTIRNPTPYNLNSTPSPPIQFLLLVVITIYFDIDFWIYVNIRSTNCHHYIFNVHAWYPPPPSLFSLSHTAANDHVTAYFCVGASSTNLCYTNRRIPGIWQKSSFFFFLQWVCVLGTCVYLCVHAHTHARIYMTI